MQIKGLIYASNSFLKFEAKLQEHSLLTIIETENDTHDSLNGQADKVI